MRVILTQHIIFLVTPSIYPEPILNAKKQGVTNLVQFQSSSLNTNARMYLWDTPRETMVKDLMFQILYSTSTSKDLGLIPITYNFIFSCASKIHAQYKGFHTHVFHIFSINTI